MGMPTWHPHPKTPLGLCPLVLPCCFGFVFLFGYAFEVLPLVPACMQLCMHKYKRKMGRMVHGTMAPLPSSLLLFFGEWARDDQPFDFPVKRVVLAPPSPSIGP